MSEISCFMWQDSVDAAMEFMAGYNDQGGGKVRYERKIRRADLRDGIVVLCPLRTEHYELVVETRSMGLWIEWPLFGVHIAKFEMEQCVNANDINLADYCPLFALAPTFKQHTLRRKIVAKANKK